MSTGKAHRHIRPIRGSALLIICLCVLLGQSDPGCLPSLLVPADSAPIGDAAPSTGQPATPSPQLVPVNPFNWVYVVPLPTQGTPGPTDHGALTGLNNDDHPQYVIGGETNSVSTAMIVNSAVTNAKIASVDPAKISPQGAGSGLDADTLDGVHAAALEESSEIDADIATHAAIANAHHTRYTDAEAVTAAQTAQVGFLVGEVRMWAGPQAAVPTGWLLCDGADVSRAGATANLFATLGTIYGVGDGSTTFTLPDFRDRTPMGASTDNAGVPVTTVEGPQTQSGGASTHALTIAEMPAHDHDITHTHDVTTVSGVGLAGPNIGIGAIGTVQTSGPTPADSGMTGSGNAHPILDPNFAIHYIIYVGS